MYSLKNIWKKKQKKKQTESWYQPNDIICAILGQRKEADNDLRF